MGKFFLDENGNESERAGPDLTKATPIEAVIDSLKGLRTGRDGRYGGAFYHACIASGITVSAVTREDGSEHLQFCIPMDSQVELRNPRYKALVAHLEARDARRQSVVDLLKLLGIFHDMRPFSSREEAIGEMLAVDARIMLRPDFRLEEAPNDTKLWLNEDWKEGYPRRRVWQRYTNTIRTPEDRAAVASLVRRQGRRLENGWYVLERTDVIAEQVPA